MKQPTKDTMASVEAENARLVGIIADGLAALDEGRMGDLRRILKTGKGGPIIAGTGVIAHDGAAR